MVRVFITNMDCELVNAFMFVAVGVWKCLWKCELTLGVSVWEFVWIVIVCVRLFAIWYVCVGMNIVVCVIWGRGREFTCVGSVSAHVSLLVFLV